MTLVAIALTSCSTRTPGPRASGTSTPSGAASTSARASNKSVRVVTARQALYVYQNAIWLYDVKTNTTRQVTQGGFVLLPKWIDANHFSFIEGGRTLEIVDLKVGTTTAVFTAPGAIQAYGWSPDHETVAYIELDSSSYPHVRYRSISDGATESVATLAYVPGRGAIQGEDLQVEFSKDGAYVLVVYTPAEGTSSTVPPEQSRFQIRGSDGSLVFSDDMTRQPTMGIFSRDGKTVYFMDSGGVRAWSAASGETRTVRRMQWFHPWLSPDGNIVSFDTGDFSAKVRVRTLDLRSLTVRTVSIQGRGFPVFAGPASLWIQEIVPCPGACDSPTLFGRVFQLNTTTGKESVLPMHSLLQVDVLYA